MQIGAIVLLLVASSSNLWLWAQQARQARQQAQHKAAAELATALRSPDSEALWTLNNAADGIAPLTAHEGDTQILLTIAAADEYNDQVKPSAHVDGKVS